MKVIILSVSNYKDKDCIYNAISEEGYLSFQAKGAQDPKGKYLWLNNPLTVADVEFMEDGRYKHKLLKAAMLKQTAVSGGESLEYLFSVSALAELSRNVLPDEEKHLEFNLLLAALKALKAKKDHYMVILTYMAKLVELSGTKLEVDKCVFCGSTHHIVTFSFEDGGFVCTNCFNSEMGRDLKKEHMKLIRCIFKAKNFDYIDVGLFSVDVQKLVLKKLTEFIDSFVGVTLKTLEPLLK